MARPRQFALVLLCGTVTLAGWSAARLGGFEWSDIENTAASIWNRGPARGAAISSPTLGHSQWLLPCNGVHGRCDQVPCTSCCACGRACHRCGDGRSRPARNWLRSAGALPPPRLPPSRTAFARGASDATV